MRRPGNSKQIKDATTAMKVDMSCHQHKCQTANGQPFGEPMSLIGSNNYWMQIAWQSARSSTPTTCSLLCLLWLWYACCCIYSSILLVSWFLCSTFFHVFHNITVVLRYVDIIRRRPWRIRNLQLCASTRAIHSPFLRYLLRCVLRYSRLIVILLAYFR